MTDEEIEERIKILEQEQATRFEQEEEAEAKREALRSSPKGSGKVQLPFDT